ncbi:hypothetical protein K435DRAFT_787314 [Dendrothele bispora CBS 962.96]|uniref:Uncharacterized protein n=1 Tax=Dendrothele bispora (strain CBS 962.96) TaxID=1314807 RepID=A0A4S8KL36_DENBC|nr:hypothetical protein K435DRAFT_787314 [Dendrothele bispora CBS 962.96]
MEGGSDTAALAGKDQGELTTDDPQNDNVPPAETTIHNTSQPNEHPVEAGTSYADELGHPNRDEASPPTDPAETRSTAQRKVDAGSSTKAEKSGMDAARDKGSNVGDGNEMTSVDRREVGQVGRDLDTEEAVGIEQSQATDVQGDGTTSEKSEDTGEADKSVDSQFMSDRSQTEDGRTGGEKEETETAAVAEGGTSKTERYEENGAKVETPRESQSETIPGVPAARESGVDESGDPSTSIEQLVGLAAKRMV